MGQEVKRFKDILEEIMIPSLKDVELWDDWITIKVRRKSTYRVLKMLRNLSRRWSRDGAGVSMDMIIRAGLSLLVRHLKKVAGGELDGAGDRAHARGGC